MTTRTSTVTRCRVIRRLLDAIERRHRRKTIRWNATHPRPCVTTKPRRKP